MLDNSNLTGTLPNSWGALSQASVSLLLVLVVTVDTNLHSSTKSHMVTQPLSMVTDYSQEDLCHYKNWDLEDLQADDPDKNGSCS